MNISTLIDPELIKEWQESIHKAIAGEELTIEDISNLIGTKNYFDGMISEAKSNILVIATDE